MRRTISWILATVVLLFASQLVSSTVAVGAGQPSIRAIPHAGSYAQDTPRLEVAPAMAAPGEAVTLSGTGWPPGVSATARMYESLASLLAGGPSELVGAFQADAQGNWSGQGTVPTMLLYFTSRGNRWVVPGTYLMVVSGGPDVSASVPFMVGAPRQGAFMWGVVAVDANGNGQFDAGDSRTEAEISITGPTPDMPARRLRTDPTGQYTLSPIPPGVYSLSTGFESDSTVRFATATISVADRQVTRADLLIEPVPAAPSVDARIEVVFPHDEQGNVRPASEATLVNVEVFLFQRGSLNPVSCDFANKVTLRWARNNPQIPAHYD